jgi:FMN phosphatase YigB (HAD superfamily)
MKDAYVIDVFQTMVDVPGLADLLADNPEFQNLNKESTTKDQKRNLVAILDDKVTKGEIEFVEVPGTRKVLDYLAGNATLVAYSSGTMYSIDCMLEQSGLEVYFPESLRLSDSETLKVSKKDATGYNVLQDRLGKKGLQVKLFVDDTELNVVAARKSNIGIPSLYHLEREDSGLLVPKQMMGYQKIGGLDQMKEMKKGV